MKMKINLLILFPALFLVCLRSGISEEPKPNIIFILADDLGWAELGSYGNTFNETPNLDHLADEGMRFKQAYAAAPVCSPYRASFLTGQVPARIGITDYLRPSSSNALSTEHVTLPKILQRNGYATGMIGKWHLTGYRHHEAEFEVGPLDHGFDWTIGREVKGVGNGANTWPYVFRDQPISWLDLKENRLGEEEYLTDRLNLEAVEFIERSSKQDRPFFLYLSHYAPHSILSGRKDLVEKYRKKHAPGKSSRENCYLCEDAGLGKGDPGNHWAADHNPHLAAMLESIDNGVGKITEKLNSLGIEENTIVIFTSDNGGETNVTSNAPLRGGKSELYEGGIRVPLIVRWPSQISKSTVSEVPTMNTDFYPTFLDALEIEPDSKQRLDGVSVMESWRDPESEPEREFLAWHYPLDQPHFLGGISGGSIREGNWKLIENFVTGKFELYSLADDLSETKNLAEEKTEITADLKSKLVLWRDSIGARMPSPPILTETRNLYFGDHFSPGLVSERLWYSKDWVAEGGILKRLATGTDNTRIFLRDAEYKDVVIRFDFRMGEAKDIRLMTGSGGGYNAVVHLRPDHFFIQTALDRFVPYFSYRHGECAFQFDPNRWYTMTVEFLGNEVIAHLDQEHVAHAKHPMVDQTRQYLALQVDEHAAEFDNFQVFSASAKNSDAAASARAQLTSMIDKYPVERTLEEQFQIEKVNAHERLYQNDEKYRTLVIRVDELDERNKALFSDAYRSHKEYRKEIADERRKLHDNDPVYKESLFATHRAKRALEAFLIGKKPEIDDWPRSRKEAEMERLRKHFENEEGYQALAAVAWEAQSKLENNYPQIYISDEEIRAMKKAAADAVKDDPEYKKAKGERAAAYRAQQDYLMASDGQLADLIKKIGEAGK